MSKKDIIFQITDWDSYNEEEEEELKYVIKLYGTDEEGQKIYTTVREFKPFFYVEIPRKWRKNQITIFIDTIKRKVSKYQQETLSKTKVIERHKFDGFTNYEKFKFIKLTFTNYIGYIQYRKVLERKISNRLLTKYPKQYRLYESNIEPMLRFMHIQDIEASGWVRIKKNKYTSEKKGNIIEVDVKWKNIERYEGEKKSELIIASFDIECMSADGSFPQPQRDGDPVIQIGTTFNYYGESECFYKHIVTLGECEEIEGVEVESYEDEKEVLMGWTKIIQEKNPDIITGYNIFGFDFKYLQARAKKLGIEHKFSILGRVEEKSKFIEKQLSSSALGDNMLYYYNMKGRVIIDLLKVIQRDYKLGSYKLDNVASTFIRENIIEIKNKKNKKNKKKKIKIKTKSTYGITKGRYIKIYYNNGLIDEVYENGKKFKILKLKEKEMIVEGEIDNEILDIKKYKIYWSQAKDDVSPRELFELQRGTAKDRARIASYCIQDNVLCNILLEKLQIVTNSISMSNVCSVPLSYIFLRAQTIKSFSLVSKECRKEEHLIPVLNNKKKYDENGEEIKVSFDGAEVLLPKIGVHMSPVTVLDYGSLYPSSMIHRNTSHETLVTDEKYDNLPGYDYVDVKFIKNNQQVTKRFVLPKDGKLGIIPKILKKLLSERSNTKKKMAQEQDPFKKNILNGHQLALKITANSLYGLIGSTISPVGNIDIAASITATGREMLHCARIFTEYIYPIIIKSILKENYESYKKKINLLFDKKIDELLGETQINKLKNIHIKVNNDPEDNSHLIRPNDYYYTRIFQEKRETITDETFINKENEKKNIRTKEQYIKYLYEYIKNLLKNIDIKPKCIYGDTDSIFVDYDQRINNIKQTDKESLERSIKIGIICGDLINYVLPAPQNLEYEKTFWPWISLSKKRYVGNLYEFNSDKFYQKNMGIVLVRRDNAPIVKIVIGGIIDKLLNERSIEKAVTFTKDELKKILSGKYSIDKFIITKTLKGNGLTEKERLIEEQKDKSERKYVNRSNIVHAVLSDRMADRDPGNKPQSNDRIPYVYIITNKKIRVQGDRVEHPDYIIKNNLHIDYLFYITNQIMKPAIQFLEILVKQPNKIFDHFINIETNRRKGKKPIKYLFNNLSNNNDNNKNNNNNNKVNFNVINDIENFEVNNKIKKNKTKKVKKNKMTKIENNDIDKIENNDKKNIFKLSLMD